ncbi:MAG: hypothetical protein WA704_23850, partial [Pseudolabrys sp.]
RVAAVNWSRSFAEGGGLISYGPYLVDEHRRAATYADRILKGESLMIYQCRRRPNMSLLSISRLPRH